MMVETGDTETSIRVVKDGNVKKSMDRRAVKVIALT